MSDFQTKEQRSELKCEVSPVYSKDNYKYVVICSYYNGQKLLSRHKNRNTWEFQGGHIEADETPLEAAKRELFEESGVVDADLTPVCDYRGWNDSGSAEGVVFLGKIHKLGNLPESEMAETRLFDNLPENLTYPLVIPVLFGECEKIL